MPLKPINAIKTLSTRGLSFPGGVKLSGAFVALRFFSLSHLKVVEWYLVGGELCREESDADDDEEEAVEARTHDEEGRPERERR